MSGQILALGDFAGMSEDMAKAKILKDFEISPPDSLDGVSLVVAVMETDGYESAAFIVFEKDGQLFEVNGSHCSCFGYEGQWDPEPVDDILHILERADWALTSAYDDRRERDAKAIRDNLTAYAAKEDAA